MYGCACAEWRRGGGTGILQVGHETGKCGVNATPVTAHSVDFPRTRRLTLHKENRLLLTLGVILLVIWALCFLAFHVTVGLIHILIVIAVIAIIMHFIRGSRTTRAP